MQLEGGTVEYLRYRTTRSDDCKMQMTDGSSRIPTCPTSKVPCTRLCNEMQLHCRRDDANPRQRLTQRSRIKATPRLRQRQVDRVQMKSTGNAISVGTPSMVCAHPATYSVPVDCFVTPIMAGMRFLTLYGAVILRS